MPGAEMPDTDFWQKRAAIKVGKQLWVIALIDGVIQGLTFLGWRAQNLTPLPVIFSGVIAFLITCIGFWIVCSNAKGQLLNRAWVVGFSTLYGVITLIAIGMISYACWIMWLWA